MISHSKVLDKILELLDSAEVYYQKLEHEPVYTSEDAAKIRDTNASQGAKALILYADKKPVLVVVPGDKKVDFKKYKTLTGTKDLRMATPEEVLELTGLEIGSIPPVGRAMDLPSYYDKSFEEKDVAAFNAGAHTVSVVMNAADLIKVEEPILADLTKE